MINSFKLFIAAILLITLNQTLSGQKNAKEIYIRATDQLLLENMQMRMELEITDKRGRVKEKTFEVMVAKFGDTEKTKMSWEKPEAAKGTTVIFTEIPDETGIIEVFTPSNGKVRKLQATSDNMDLMGTEMSMTSLPSQNPDDLTFSLLEPQTVAGKSCYNIEVKAKDATDDGRGELLVEMDSYRLVQITVYNEEGAKISFVTLSDFQPVTGMPEKIQPMLIVTEDFENKKLTEMRVLNISRRTDFKEEDFKLPEEQDI